MILFTSGSTGRPKGVMHSHGAVDALIRRTRRVLGDRREDRLFVPSPIGHIGGAIYAFEFPWITGCTALLAEGWDPDDAVSGDRYPWRHLHGRRDALSGRRSSPPRSAQGRTCRACVALSAVERASRRNWCAAGSSSSRRPSSRAPTDRPRFRSCAPAFATAARPSTGRHRRRMHGELQILSTAETPGRRTADPGRSSCARRRCCSATSIRPTTRPASPRTVSSAWATSAALSPGRFLEITGRRKDIIIRKGENISPLEIENALARHRSVRQSAVVGVPDAARGEIAVAFVLPVDGATSRFPDMTAHLETARACEAEIPRSVCTSISSLPRQFDRQDPEERVERPLRDERGRARGDHPLSLRDLQRHRPRDGDLPGLRRPDARLRHPEDLQFRAWRVLHDRRLCGACDHRTGSLVAADVPRRRADRGRDRGRIGILADLAIFRRLAGVPADYTLMAAFGIMLLCTGGTTDRISARTCTRSIRPPARRAFRHRHPDLGYYGLFLIGCGIAVFLVLEIGLNRFWFGKLILAVARDPWMADVSGFGSDASSSSAVATELCAGRTGGRAAGRQPVAVARSRPFLPAAGLLRGDRRRPRLDPRRVHRGDHLRSRREPELGAAADHAGHRRPMCC